MTKGPDQTLEDSEAGLLVLSPADRSDELAHGSRAGAYTIVRLLGRGGFGAVYAARPDDGGPQVALKVLHRQLLASRPAVERFLREVATLERLRHPNIVAIHASGRLPDGRPYFAMELLEGETLSRIVKTRGRSTIAEAYPILTQVCAALEVAHAGGVVHRDLKADNVLVDAGGGVKLVDFGIAKLLEPEPGSAGLTSSHQIVGTLIAMSPEQLRGQPVDARTDVYALGVLAFQLLTGDVPFRGSAEEVMWLHMEGQPRPPSALAAVAPALDAIVLRCLEKSPAARYASVTDVAAALRAAVLGGAARVDAEPATQARVGLGILVKAHAGPGSSEDALAAGAAALDAADQALRAAGYVIVLATSSEVLGVRLASETPDEERAERRRAIELGKEVHATVGGLAGPEVRVAVTVHSDGADVAPGSDVISGGALLDVERWDTPGGGLTISASVRRDLPPEA